MYKLIRRILFVLLFVFCMPAAASALNITATTFPVYHLLCRVVSGIDGVTPSLLVSARTGCPHDYMLTPADMRRLESADVLLINGLGMEDFLKLPEGGNTFRLIDLSKCLEKEVLYYPDEDNESEHHEHENHDHGHAHAGIVNPHAFASPRLLAVMARFLARELGNADPAHATAYTENAEKYAALLDSLALDFSALGKQLLHKKIVTQHGVFDYLAHDMGLEIVASVQSHAGHEPSAAELISLAKKLVQRGAAAIFVEPQYPQKSGETLSRETGIPMAELDPAASGPENASGEYVIDVMRSNMNTLEKMLGRK